MQGPPSFGGELGWPNFGPNRLGGQSTGPTVGAGSAKNVLTSCGKSSLSVGLCGKTETADMEGPIREQSGYMLHALVSLLGKGVVAGRMAQADSISVLGVRTVEPSIRALT